MMTKTSKQKITLRSFPHDERVFLQTLITNLPPRFRDIFAAYKLTEPAFLHLLYKLVIYKTRLLEHDDERLWEKLVHEELQLIHHA